MSSRQSEVIGLPRGRSRRSGMDQLDMSPERCREPCEILAIDGHDLIAVGGEEREPASTTSSRPEAARSSPEARPSDSSSARTSMFVALQCHKGSAVEHETHIDATLRFLGRPVRTTRAFSRSARSSLGVDLLGGDLSERRKGPPRRGGTWTMPAASTRSLGVARSTDQ